MASNALRVARALAALVLIAVALLLVAACDLRFGVEPYWCAPLDSVDVRTDTFDLNCQIVGRIPDSTNIP